jgi:hypothetical protein
MQLGCTRDHENGRLLLNSLSGCSFFSEQALMAEALMVSDPLDDGILKRLRSAEASARRWRWAALFAAAVALISGAALAAAAVALLRGARQSDERLLGTWQSDADRTVSEHLKARPGLSELKAGQEEWAFRHNAGKRRFTYNPAEGRNSSKVPKVPGRLGFRLTVGR